MIFNISGDGSMSRFSILSIAKYNVTQRNIHRVCVTDTYTNIYKQIFLIIFTHELNGEFKFATMPGKNLLDAGTRG